MASAATLSLERSFSDMAPVITWIDRVERYRKYLGISLILQRCNGVVSELRYYCEIIRRVCDPVFAVFGALEMFVARKLTRERPLDTPVCCLQLSFIFCCHEDTITIILIDRGLLADAMGVRFHEPSHAHQVVSPPPSLSACLRGCCFLFP